MIFDGATWWDRVKVKVRRYTNGALETSDAYRAVFTGTGTPEQASIVLNDLFKQCGMMDKHRGWTDSELQYITGYQDAVKHILRMIRLEPPEMQRLADTEIVNA